MIPSDVLQRKMGELPEPVLDYLYSERAGELNDTIISRNGLTEAQESEMFRLLRELFVKEITPERLVDEIKTRLRLDDAKATQLAADVAGYRLLPLDKWLGNITGLIRSLGADPKSYPEFRVQIEHRTADQAAKEVTASTGAATGDPHLQDRLHNVVESFLAGVRTEEQTIDVLTRSEKIGGLGLDPSSAGRVVEEIREETRSVVIDPVLVPETQVASSTVPATPKRQESDALTTTSEEEAELAKFKEASLPPKLDPSMQTVDKIEASIEEIYAASGLQTDDEGMQKRMKAVIGNRLRDVRDQMETLEIMTQPKELGGLSLSQDAARALLNAIQAKLKAVHDVHAVKLQADKAQWVEKERQQKADTEAQTATDQKADLERLYQSIVSKSKKAQKNAVPEASVKLMATLEPKPLPAPAPAVAAPAALKTPAPPNLPIGITNPVPPEFRPTPVLAPVVPAPALAAVAMASTPNVEAPRQLVSPPLTIVRPTRETPVGPPAAGQSGTFLQRPKIEDVKASPRLTGPVEELRALTILDFHRLSKDPKEAALKVKDKIDLLAEQSYTRRNEGIAAWNSSEVVRAYLELMREGLNGTPLKAAISARLAAKKTALTPEEFQAVSELSRQLRY